MVRERRHPKPKFGQQTMQHRLESDTSQRTIESTYWIEVSTTPFLPPLINTFKDREKLY